MLAYFYVRYIGRIRRYLSVESCASLVQVYIASRLGYWNSLLFCLPNRCITRFQRISNRATWLSHRLENRDRIRPLNFTSLHWVPVPFQLKHNKLITIFKSLHGLVPSYPQDMVRQYDAPRSIRSQPKTHIIIPPSNTSTFRNWMFPAATGKFSNFAPRKVHDKQNFAVFRWH